MHRCAYTLLAIFLGMSVAHALEITPCDLEIGHPSDPDHVGPGKPTSAVVTHVAIPACRDALASAPDNPRFHYQLGRALFYWAEANNGDTVEAMLLGNLQRQPKTRMK